MTHSTYTWTSPSSAAIKQLQLNGYRVAASRSAVAGSFPGSSVVLPRIDTAHVVSAAIPGDGGATPVAGDFLFVSVISDDAVGQSITSPATGWNPLTAIVGVGTVSVLYAMFWKQATSSDLTNPLTFTVAHPANVAAYEFSVPQATIDNVNPVVMEADSVSTGDLMALDGPSTVGPGNPPISVFELVASAWSVATGNFSDGVSANSENNFIDRDNDGLGGSGTIPGIIGFRYYFRDIWNVGEVAWYGSS